VHAAGIDPSIVEIEERTDGDGEVNGFVIPAGGSHETGVLGRNSGRLTIHLVNEPEQLLVFLIERGAVQIAKHAPDQFLTS